MSTIPSFGGSRRLHGQNRTTAGREWQPKRQKDEERIICLARYARRWQPDTQVLFTGYLQALGSINCADPAPSNDLVRGQPGALFQWCMFSRDYKGDLNELVGILLGHMQGDSGNTPLHRPG